MNYHFIKATGAALLFAAVALITPMNAEAGEMRYIRAQIVCHDGANRGTDVRIFLGQSKARRFYQSRAKSYYASTECVDLADYDPGKVKRYDFINVWYNAVGNRFTGLCADFKIIYKPTGRTIWIQNGGTHFENVTCVAKEHL